MGNLIKFDFKYNILKKPVIIIYLLIFPIVTFVILQFIMANEFSGEILASDYYGITVMIYFQLTMGTMISNMIMEESVKLPNMRIAYSLKNDRYIYISKIIALSFSDFFSILWYIVILKNFFHVDFGSNMCGVLVAYCCLGVFSTCLGTFLCILIKDESVCNNILGVIQLVLCALGGIFFPISSLGRIGVVVSNISIVKWINYGFGRYIYGNDYIYIGVICLVCCICSMMFLYATKKIFRIEKFI